MTFRRRMVWHRAALHCAFTLALAFGATSALALKRFDTPDAAMDAFGQAVLNNDEPAMKAMLGNNFRAVIPPVGADIRDKFRQAWAVSHSIQRADGHAFIVVGNDGWTLPVPLVRSGHGWQFDIVAGAQEMRVRRIGRNELAAIQTLLAICDAQGEYARTIHDDGKLYVYADKLSSTSGKHDGLYWPTGQDEPPSPLGPALRDASIPNRSPDGYNGYRYKLLAAQGAHAQSGARDYMLDGKLLGGFAVIAWPARYGDTGVMTFIVSHIGVVYERDLGPNTAAKAVATRLFDPAPGWRRVSP